MNPVSGQGSFARHLLWRRILDDKSHEFFELTAGAEAATMTGWIIAESQPALVTYQLVTSADLARARALDVVSRPGGQIRHLRIEAGEQGAWTIDGARQTDFGDCTDVRALWVRMPHLAVEPALQRYTRLADDRFLYESLGSGFKAELAVDELGLPETYAEIWRAIARWRSA